MKANSPKISIQTFLPNYHMFLFVFFFFFLFIYIFTTLGKVAIFNSKHLLAVGRDNVSFVFLRGKIVGWLHVFQLTHPWLQTRLHMLCNSFSCFKKLDHWILEFKSFDWLSYHDISKAYAGSMFLSSHRGTGVFLQSLRVFSYRVFSK